MTGHPHGLARAKATRIPGCCAFCEEPTPNLYCYGSRQPKRGQKGYECFRAFQRSYYLDLRARRGCRAYTPRAA